MAWSELVPSRDELHEAKRRALLREAASAFTRKGFHAASLDDIAQRLGVTKAALYHYFPSKHALLAECFARAFEVGFDGLDEARQAGGTGREKLHHALRHYLKEMIDELSCCVVLMEEHALLPDDHARLLKDRDRFEQALRALIREGIEDGSIAPCDPKLAVFAILGAIHWVPKWFRHDGPWSAAEVSDALTDLLDRMVSAKPAKALAPVGKRRGKAR
ncbi:MAG TPA: TetR/AcrR family transcriptional regulator [Alphaproteobacteria bacterium]|nr:TetR/AcrR family transcriptional regulator [Alphaproteobacteria bacterium]